MVLTLLSFSYFFYKKGRLDVGVFWRLEDTEEWGREGAGKMRGLWELESDIDTEGVRKEPLPLTPG